MYFSKRNRRLFQTSGWWCGMLLWALVGGCATGGARSTVRLVEAFNEDSVEGEAVEVPAIEPTQWQGSTLDAFKAVNGISGHRLSETALSGRSTSIVPVLMARQEVDPSYNDVLYAVEVRMKASAGENLFVRFDPAEEPDVAQLVKSTEEGDSFGWSLRTPIVADGTTKTYTLYGADSFTVSFKASGMRHVQIRPTDVAGADFEIESVRLIFRQEHLSNIPSGISWQTMQDVFRETIVSRAPERVSFDVQLGADPWLDLAVGTVEEGAVTFRVDVDGGGTTEPLLRRTVTTPHRWETIPVDLSEFANRGVKLTLSLEGAADGTLGFWGSPVIRSRQAPAPGRPRGVILIIGDTLRRDHLNLYGYQRTTAPHLTDLAARGFLFADNQSQATWTKVSVPSILTSLYPTTHGISDLFDRLSASVETVAEAYQGAGYATWASSSVPFSGKLTNLHQGVEVLYERSAVAEGGSKTARPFVDQLLPWLEDHKDGPFFARVHAFDPHSPFEPRAPYNTLFNEDGEPEQFAADVEKVREHIEDASRRQRMMPDLEELEKAGVDPEQFVAFEHTWYDGSIRGLDAEIGRIVTHLESLGMADDVLIAFISDHGEEFLEHGRHWHGNTIYGDMTNVPLIVSWPAGLPGGRVIEQTVQSIDLMPTLLELSGIEIPEQVQGESLVSLLRSDSSAVEYFSTRPVFSERKHIESETSMEKIDSQAIVADGWKLVHNTRKVGEMPDYELYDHRADPLNLVDVAVDNPEVVARLSALLEQWRTGVEEAATAIDSAAESLSPEELQKLRSLGYIN